MQPNKIQRAFKIKTYPTAIQAARQRLLTICELIALTQYFKCICSLIKWIYSVFFSSPTRSLSLCSCFSMCDAIAVVNLLLYVFRIVSFCLYFSVGSCLQHFSVSSKLFAIFNFFYVALFSSML